MKPTFLLLSCPVHKNIEVAKKIKKNDGVQEAIPVYGTYDCLIKTDDIPPKEIQDLINSTIKPLSNVSAVLPLYTSPDNLPRSNDK